MVGLAWATTEGLAEEGTTDAGPEGELATGNGCPPSCSDTVTVISTTSHWPELSQDLPPRTADLTTRSLSLSTWP